MEDLKKKNGLDANDKEIVFSQSIRTDERIYYLDVRKNKKNETFLATTEGKRIVMGEGDDLQISFKRHKIFLYKEDSEKFMNGLQQTIDFIQEQQRSYARHNNNGSLPNSEQPTAEQEEEGSPLDGEIEMDIDF